MGTRNLICVYYKGRFAIAQYGQWDGYPAGQGAVLWRFIWNNPGNIARLKAGLEHVRIATEDDLDRLRRLSDRVYPSLSRDTGAKILELVACATEERGVPVTMFLEFVNDRVMCEWIYVLDLDAEVLEVYAGDVDGCKYLGAPSGYQQRFSEVGGGCMAFIKGFELADLPGTEKEFVEALKLPEYEEDKADV